MLTVEQEQVLAEFADKLIAEKAEVTARNNQILIDAKVSAARKEKQAELEAQAKADVDAGLQDFDTNVAPVLASEVVADAPVEK